VTDNTRTTDTLRPVPRSLSVVVVGYDMDRELPRTLQTLAPPYQRDIDAGEYEIIVVDNGSPRRIGREVAPPGVAVRCLRLDAAPPSPARAANAGIREADGDLVGLIVDGARLASPRLLATARQAHKIAPRGVITSPAYHLGGARHMDADEIGYDQRAEDALLEASGWPADGYELFRISTLAGSSGRGWFGPMGESSALFMGKEHWHELRGLDERFDLPGGGLVNHDLYRRACALGGAQPVVLLGEGTFHQIHGGAATTRRYTWDEMHAQYEAIRGVPYEPPDNDALYLGRVPDSAIAHLELSTRWLAQHAARPTHERDDDRGEARAGAVRPPGWPSPAAG